MFPGAGANVYYNEAGEPLGWDYPSYDEPEYDPDDYLPSDDDDEEGEDEEEEGARPGPGQAEDNYVYRMSCGHEYDSPRPLEAGVSVWCSAHGETRIVEE